MDPSLPVAALVRTDFCIPHTDALRDEDWQRVDEGQGMRGSAWTPPLPAVDETERWSCLLSDTDKLDACSPGRLSLVVAVERLDQICVV